MAYNNYISSTFATAAKTEVGTCPYHVTVAPLASSPKIREEDGQERVAKGARCGEGESVRICVCRFRTRYVEALITGFQYSKTCLQTSS